MTPADLLNAITRTVDGLPLAAYCQVDSSAGWLSCAELVSDDRLLLEIVHSAAEARGTERFDVACSLFVQAYAFRIASAAIGGWLVSGGRHTLDVGAANTAIMLEQCRPTALAFGQVRFRPQPIHDVVFDGHLTPFVRNVHRTMAESGDRRVGERLLWGNVGAACAASFGLFDAVLYDRAAVRLAAEDFFAGAPINGWSTGRFTAGGVRGSRRCWRWQRTSCCLLYQLESLDPDSRVKMCGDCSLSPAGRRSGSLP